MTICDECGTEFDDEKLNECPDCKTSLVKVKCQCVQHGCFVCECEDER